jgi:hypothetical protein
VKKNNAKKLALSKETLARLDGPKLGLVEGGAWSENSICPTTAPSEARPCARGLDHDNNG